ncbi:GTPase activating protein and VPS9 domains 1, partial [Aphelenchoides avenae]
NTDQPYYDPANIVQCKAFVDAKRKLRLVLSSAANVPTNGTARATGMSIGGIIIDAGGTSKNNAV